MYNKMPKTNKAIVSRMKRLEKKVNKMQDDVEYKFKDSAFAFSMTSTGIVSDLGLGSIVQGTSVDDRIGRDITVSSIRVRGYLNYGDSWNKWRILVVRLPNDDNSLDGLNVADVLADTNNWYNSFYRRNSGTKFKVLADRRGYINAPISTTSTLADSKQSTNWKPYQNINFTFKFKGGLKVSYSSDAYSVPARNPVFMILLSDSFVTDHPDYRCNTRCTFTDA